MKFYLIALVFLIIVGCTPAVYRVPDSTPEFSPILSPTDIPNPVTPDIVQEKMIDLAISNLSTLLSLDPDMVHVLSAESKTWPDSSLGCPQPSEIYTQILIEGYFIRLEAKELIFNYHTDTRDQVFLCEEVGLPSFPVTPGEIDDGQPWVPVD